MTHFHRQLPFLPFLFEVHPDWPLVLAFLQEHAALPSQTVGLHVLDFPQFCSRPFSNFPADWISFTLIPSYVFKQVSFL